MSLQIANNPSVQDIVHCYSGRRLQFAIKLGIMPTPESFSLILKRIINTENCVDSTVDRGTTKLNSYQNSNRVFD